MARVRKQGEELRAAGRLAIEATTAVTGVVEKMHRTIASGPNILGRPFEREARILTGAVYGTIKGVTRLVGAGIDAVLAQLAPLLDGGSPGPEREAVLAVLNGVLGDHLAETKNPLAIEMSLRQAGKALPLEAAALRAVFPAATGKVVVLVHGSCMNDLQWKRHGHDHGAALEKDLGFTPVYAHYNTGLHISTNGHQLAAQLEALVSQWPVPVEELVLLGHSMGGLVARAACHDAEAAGLAWRGRLRKMVFLGSPHHGAPLERAGSWVDLLLGGSRYSAPLAGLGKIRSAGVTDLRFGNVLDAHWRGRDRFEFGIDSRAPLPLPREVGCYAIAATLSPKGSPPRLGDGMVPIDSALGRHRRSELALAFLPANTCIVPAAGHLDLLGRPKVYPKLRRWIAA